MINPDNTARKQAEAALLKAGALQSAIFNSANFSSIATDAKGVIQIFNVGAERMLGYLAADVTNKITPADISDPQEVVARALALSVELGTPITPGFEALVFKASRGIEDIYELTYIRKDGSRFPAVVSVTALRDAQNAIIGYLLIGTDNTARKQIEANQLLLDQRLRDQQFYTRSLIESNMDAIMTTDSSGIITDVNKQMEALTGSTREELIGAPFKSHFTDPERAEAAITLVLNEKKVSNYELTACARDGTETVVSYNAMTLYDREGRLRGVFAAARDVTERQRFERALQESNIELERSKSVAEKANLAKSVFLASMSHELRTPLNAILGFSRLMRDDSLVSEKHRNTLDIINHSGEHLLGLINDVLDMAKIEAGRVGVENAPFDLRGEVRDVSNLMRGRAEEKRLELRLDQSLDFPNFVCADAVKLRQVLLNLVGNAVKFTEQGHVTLRLSVQPSDIPKRLCLVFEIADSGIGIAAEDQQRIFEPFIQLHHKSDQKGTGLGLTITRQHVALMGGAITVQSIPDIGSLFRVEIPAERVEASAVGADQLERGRVVGLVPGQPPYRLLIVEDEIANWLLLQHLLDLVGFDVRVAKDGESGLNQFQTWRPHLIWMDIRLPIMDGLEATRRIRALEGGQVVKIVALTASVFQEERIRIVGVGMDDFIRKPYRPEEIYDCLTRHLGVSFVHEFGGETRPTAELPRPLRREELAVLSQELRTALEKALISLDGERIAEVIRYVSAQNSEFGRRLTKYADRFEYTAIMEAL